MNRIDRWIDLKDGVDEEVDTFDIVVIVDEVGAMDNMEPYIYIYIYCNIGVRLYRKIDLCSNLFMFINVYTMLLMMY